MATSCSNTAYWLIHLFLQISMLPFPYTNFSFVLRPHFGLLIVPVFCPQNSTTVLNIAPLQSIWVYEVSTWMCITFFFRIFLEMLWLSVSLFSHLSHSFSYSKIHVKEAPPPCYLWISFLTALFNFILGFTLFPVLSTRLRVPWGSRHVSLGNSLKKTKPNTGCLSCFSCNILQFVYGIINSMFGLL